MASSKKPVPRIISASVFSFLDSCFLYSFIKPILKTPPHIAQDQKQDEKTNKCFLVSDAFRSQEWCIHPLRSFISCGKKSPLLPVHRSSRIRNVEQLAPMIFCQYLSVTIRCNWCASCTALFQHSWLEISSFIEMHSLVGKGWFRASYVSSLRGIPVYHPKV